MQNSSSTLMTWRNHETSDGRPYRSRDHYMNDWIAQLDHAINRQEWADASHAAEMLDTVDGLNTVIEQSDLHQFTVPNDKVEFPAAQFLDPHRAIDAPICWDSAEQLVIHEWPDAKILCWGGKFAVDGLGWFPDEPPTDHQVSEWKRLGIAGAETLLWHDTAEAAWLNAARSLMLRRGCFMTPESVIECLRAARTNCHWALVSLMAYKLNGFSCSSVYNNLRTGLWMVEKAAARWGVSVEQVQRWIDERKVAANQYGGRWMIIAGSPRPNN